MISAVDNNIIRGMSGTTSGAYCQRYGQQSAVLHASVIQLSVTLEK